MEYLFHPFCCLVEQNNIKIGWKKVINDNNILITNNSKLLFKDNLKNVQLQYINKIKIF